MTNSGRIEIGSSIMDSLRPVHGVVYVIFYGRIRIPRISGNFSACVDSVYQALLSPHEGEPGFEASCVHEQLAHGLPAVGVVDRHGQQNTIYDAHAKRFEAY